MTTYLDDTWLQAELQRFEATKQALQEAAVLLERATTAVPQLQRGLEQLEQHERKTRKNLEQLSSEQRRELGGMVTQAQADFDAHVQAVMRKLSAMGEAGQLLELRQEVSGLLLALPVLEQQAEHLTEELSEVQQRYPARITGLEDQVTDLREKLGQSENHLTERLTGQVSEVRTALDALRERQADLQTHQKSQDAALQRTAQQLSEQEQAEKRGGASLNARLVTVSQQVNETQERLTWLEARQTTAESRLEQLEARVSEQILASQEQFEAKLLDLTERQESLSTAQNLMHERLVPLRTLPEQVNTLSTSLEETRAQLDTHHTQSSARLEGQREALADLERQVGSVQTRASRFIAWFEKASAMARLRGTPE